MAGLEVVIASIHISMREDYGRKTPAVTATPCGPSKKSLEMLGTL
jgi:hypothetical protein